MKAKNDHRSKFSNLSNWKEEALKKKIRASTGFEPVTSAIPVRCSTNWAMKPHIGSEVNLLSHTGSEVNKLTSLPMCGFIAQLLEHPTGIAEVTGSNPVKALIFFFKASSFQLLKLENLLRWSFFAFIIHYDIKLNCFISIFSRNLYNEYVLNRNKVKQQ